MKRSRNVTLRGGVVFENSDKNSGGMTDIQCQEGTPAGVYVSESELIVVDSISFNNCRTTALVFDSTVNATVRDVKITRSSTGLDMFNCENLSVTQSLLAYCDYGISIGDCLSVEITNSQIIHSSAFNMIGIVRVGTLTLKQIVSKGSVYGLSFALFSVKETDDDADITIESVSVTGNRSISGISIIDLYREVGPTPRNGVVRIHNVSVENLEPDPFYLNAEIYPAAILVGSLRNVIISNCTIKNNEVTGIFLLATTALLQGNIILTNNSGVNGGGMALVSNSFVVLDASTHLQLSNNSAAISLAVEYMCLKT